MNPGRTFDGQRCADLGETYLNPIVPGDHADPTILKDGDDYYMTFSSFQSTPGVVVWHSADLVNWAPLGTALPTYLGSVWAMDLVKHGGRYFLYIPVVNDQGGGIYVLHADHPRGPWSQPIRLDLDGCIDPGHCVGEDGRRYLFVNGIRRVRLTDDGLAVDGPLEKVYEPWRYPEEWEVEMFAPEGPKLFRRGDFFYLVSAVGGTAGPPTSHMVIVARSASIHGPWIDCPHNPILRTTHRDEPWWSKGHATLVEGPTGDWWMVYHAYEKDFWTLGRQTLLEPIEWTADGWPRCLGADLAQPQPKPRGGRRGPSGQPLSGGFFPEHLGLTWSLFESVEAPASRMRFEGGAVTLAGRGQAPQHSSPLTLLAGDRDYEAEVTVSVEGDTVGGLFLFYSERGFCGLGFDGREVRTFVYGQEHGWLRLPPVTGPLRLKVRNRGQVATWWYAEAGSPWVRHPWQMEVSGYHHNVFGGFTALKLTLPASGTGSATYSEFVYRGNPLLPGKG